MIAMAAQWLRMAFRVSWGGQRPDIQRALLAALAAGVATLVACAVISTSLLVQRVEDRSAARSFAPVAEGEPVAAEMHAIFDATSDGDQIYVYWWRIRDRDVRLPGVPARPARDAWFVSPALADRMDADRSLRTRFPRAHQIGRAGVANASELVAYRFVGPDVELPDRLSARRDPAMYLADPADMEVRSIVRAALALLTLPVLGLLLAGLASLATGLDRRMGVLEALGASARARSSLVFLQAVLSTLPGTVLAAAGWWVVAPRLTAVPVVGRAVFAGDLGIPAALATTTALSVALIGGIVAAVHHRGAAGTRPTWRSPRRPGAVRALTLTGAVALMVAGSGLVGAGSDRLYVAGLVASVAGGIVSLPLLFHRVGEALAESPALLPLLVGRRLAWNARATARSMVLFGALAALSPVAASWVELERVRIADPGDPATVQPVSVDGALTADEVELLRERTGAVPLDLVSEATVDPQTTPTTRQRRLLVGDCRALGRVVELARCDESGFAVAPSAAAGFARYGSPDDASPDPPQGVASRPDGFEVVATLFVGEDWRAVDAVLRAHAVNRSQPGPPVGYVENPLHESPITRWMIGGLVVAAVTAGVALGLHLAAQAARLTASRGHLRAIGADLPVVRRLAAAESALTIAVAGLTCVAIGGLAAWLFVQMNPDADLNYHAFAVVLAVILSSAAVGGATSWLTTNQDLGDLRD